MDRPDDMEGILLAVPQPEERRRRELALAGLLMTAVEMILHGGSGDLDLRIENAKDMVREFKRTYPEAREI